MLYLLSSHTSELAERRQALVHLLRDELFLVDINAARAIQDDVSLDRSLKPSLKGEHRESSLANGGLEVLSGHFH